MPEGPSIVILKESVHAFRNKKILEVGGNSKLDIQRLKGQTIVDFKTWGKHFLVCFKKFSVRIHLMLFGSYLINDTKDAIPRLSLRFNNGMLNFYACSIQFIEEDLDVLYDWSADVMSPQWDAAKAKAKLKERKAMLVCDALLDQQLFAGVGNIIKNEVLFRIKTHPLSTIGKMPVRKLNQLVKEAVHYSYQFLQWKKEFVLKKHWLAHTKKECPRDHVPLKKQYLGKTHRRSFYCIKCQLLYS